MRDTALNRVLIPDEELNRWGDFYVAADLGDLLTFDEFMREPEAIVAAMCDLSAPMPRSLPVLGERIRARAERKRCQVIDLQSRRRQVRGGAA